MSGTGRGEVVVVRHGATAWSVTGRHTGRSDLPLLPEGEEEARRAGALLGAAGFDQVLVSPLLRARRTAELLGVGDEADVTDDLLEWDYGDLEGRTTEEIRRDLPAWTVWTGPVPGGETLDDVAARAARVVTRARGAERSLVVAHGHVLRVLVAVWCQLEPIEGRRFVLHTAGVTVLGWEHDYPVVQALNQR